MYSIQVDYFDIDKIAKTRQAIMWRKIHKGKYLIQSGNDIVVVYQNKNYLVFSCNEEKFWGKWYYYFRLSEDYQKLSFEIAKQNEELKKCMIVSKGLRIIDQNFLESAITNILFEDFTKKEVKNLLKNICEICGIKRKNTIDSVVYAWYTFPDVTTILNNFEKLSISYFSCCDKLKSFLMFYESGEFNNCYGSLEHLEKFKLIDINPLTAKYILLYGLQDMSVMPKDQKCKYLLDLYNVNSKKLNDVKGYMSLCLKYYHENVSRFARNNLQMEQFKNEVG